VKSLKSKSTEHAQLTDLQSYNFIM